MAIFKFVIGNKGKTYQIEKDQSECKFLIGKRIGFRFAGDVIGLPGYELEVTGGTDQDGFPMRKDLPGTGRKKLLIDKKSGFHEKKRIKKKMKKIRGLRIRKTFRGNTISTDIVQINCKVIRQGEKPLEELIGKKEGEEKQDQ
jgi:small subunit ribosomal protein S6e